MSCDRDERTKKHDVIVDCNPTFKGGGKYGVNRYYTTSEGTLMHFPFWGAAEPVKDKSVMKKYYDMFKFALE